MKAVNYLKNNYKALLREWFFMFLVLIFSNAIANAGTGEHIFRDDPFKFFCIAFSLSIPAGIGLHFISHGFPKKSK